MLTTAPVVAFRVMDAENNFPYPVLAITDLANNYSHEHFRFAIGNCRDVIAKVIAEDNRSDQQIARVRILKLTDLQLSRAVRWVEDDADLMAGVLRSLIELKFWAHFVSESPEKATRFLSEVSIDARELYERLEKLVPTDTYQLAMPSGVGKRVAVAPSDPQESLIWKLCSKLIHPSSWVINNFEGTIHNVFQRQVLATYVLYYGWGITTIFHDVVWE
jgi:hypothetical protein